jgi:DNA-binding beta-propeller fold protein YncE
MRRRQFLQASLAGLGLLTSSAVVGRAQPAFAVRVSDARTFDFDANGDAYLRLPTLHTISRRTLNDVPVWETGVLGDQPGQLNHPKGMRRDPDRGRLYVADTGRHQIDVFSTESGAFLFQFGERGRGPGQFVFPNDVNIDHNGVIYVADTGNHRIQVFAAHGGFLRQFGGFGLSGGQLNGPVSLALPPDGTLHVADKGKSRIQVYSTAGAYLGHYGAPGTRLGQFRSLHSIAADRHGRIYAADRASWWVTLFGIDGQALLRFQPRFVDGTVAVPLGLALMPDETLVVSGSRSPVSLRPGRDLETATYLPTAPVERR